MVIDACNGFKSAEAKTLTMKNGILIGVIESFDRTVIDKCLGGSQYAQWFLYVYVWEYSSTSFCVESRFGACSVYFTIGVAFHQSKTVCHSGNKRLFIIIMIGRIALGFTISKRYNLSKYIMCINICG